MAKRHKSDTAEFAGLTGKEQAQSITAMLNNLHNAIRRHIMDARNPEKVRQKCRKQVQRFTARVERL